MADNKFQITITAVDRATKVVNQVNKNVAKVFRPYEQAQRSMKAFGTAVGRNDLVRGGLWTLDKLGSGVTRMTAAFGIAETGVLGSTARMAAGIASIGGPVGAAAAGMAVVAGGATAVGVRMGKLGTDVARTASALNISAASLQEYRAAAKRAGLETSSMDDALMAFSNTLYRAEAGMDGNASAALKTLGVDVARTKEGYLDTLGVLRRFADATSKMPDQVLARQFTDMFGLTELLPLLREGTRSLDQYRAEARRVGAVMGDDLVAMNERQAKAWNRSMVAVDAMAMSVGNLVASYVPLESIASRVAGLAERMQRSPKAQPEGSWVAPEGTWTPAPGSPGSRAAERMSRIANLGANILPLGLRNNNPGNLRSWEGAGSAGGFATFPTPAMGLAAMAKNLMIYQDRYGINTISGIVNRWAPAGDGNDPYRYAASVSKAVGVNPYQPLNLRDPSVLQPLMGAMVRQENGQQPFSPEAIGKAIADALKDGGIAGKLQLEIINAPPGIRVQPLNGQGQPTTGATMAQGGAS